jgi:hypothetical protein
MPVVFAAARPWAARSLVCAAAILIASAAAGPAARADDAAAWFGESFKGTNLGLSAGVMYLGAAGREGTSSRRGRRGTQLASLGRDDAVGTESAGEDAPRRVGKAQPARTASLGDSGVPAAASTPRAKRSAKRKAPRNVRVASLGSAFAPAPSLGPSLSGGAVRWVAGSGCLNSGLRSVVAGVAASFGSVTVNSTCRSRRHNARVGGARHSHHLTGNAVDFRVRGNWRGVWAFLRGSGLVGGIKHYGRGLFHIDTGARRTW